MTVRGCFLILLLALGSGCDFRRNHAPDPTDLLERGKSLYREKSYDQARSILQRAVQLFDRQERAGEIVDASLLLGRIDLELGNYQDAEATASAAEQLNKRTGNFHAGAEIALLIGDVNVALQEYAEAAASYRSAMTMLSTVNDESGAGSAELKLADALLASDERSEALDRYRNALGVFQKRNDRAHSAEALAGIGEVNLLQGRNVEALNSLARATSQVDPTQFPVTAARLGILVGRVHESDHDYSAAVSAYRDATNTLRRMRTGRELEPVLLFRIGSVFTATGQLADAKTYYTEAVQIARAISDRLAEAYLSLFTVRADMDLAGAAGRPIPYERLRASYEQCVKAFQSCGQRAGEAYTRTLMGRLAESHGDLTAAREEYERAITIDRNRLAEYSDREMYLPYQQKLGIDREHTEGYGLLADAFLKEGRVKEALAVMEMARSDETFRTYQWLTLNARHPKLKKELDDVRSGLRTARVMELEMTSQLAHPAGAETSSNAGQMQATLSDLLKTLRASSKNIATDHPNFEPLVLPAAPDIAAAQRSIPYGTAVLAYLPGERQLSIFVVRRDGVTARKSEIGRDRLLKDVREYLQLLHDPTVYSTEAGAANISAMTRFATLSTSLYDAFLRPVEPFLERGVVIIPGPDFEGFPFHALERQAKNGSVRSVVETMSVDYLPTLSSVSFKTASSSRIRDVIAFGNPTGKNWSIDYELRDIRSFFRGARVLIGLETSWDNIRSSKGDVLQISTEFTDGHGNLPLGEVVLSNGLTMEESMEVPFEKLIEVEPSPVVMLSNQFGQGSGLSWRHALLLRVGGVSDVFLNEWAADRKAAKFLSEYFYTNLAAGLAPGDAYRQALLSLIRTREVSHPHSWAQFFHFGIG